MTTICTFWMVAPLVSNEHDAIYHWSASPSALFLPVFRDFLLLWLLFTLLLLAAERLTNLRVAVWTGFVALLPWLAFKNLVIVEQGSPPLWVSKLLLAFCLSAFAGVVFFWTRNSPAFFERSRAFVAYMLSLAAIVGAVLFCQLCWFAWQARSLNAWTPLHETSRTTAQASPTGPRIIWILLDELSYRQVYERRFDGMRLPTFDRLASESTVWTHVVPAGIRTAEVMPSLFTGREFDRIRASGDGRRLFVHDAEADTWARFDQHHTVFQDALHAGYRTAVAGWYNPYCRLLPKVLDSCFWIFQATENGNLNLEFSSLAAHAVSKLLGRKEDNVMLSGHISDYQQISAAADPLLADPSDNFVLIHMCVPHPNGIYDRATGQFATHSSTYLDNLVLADHYLAHVRSALEARGQWDSSAIIVMGDHSWRTTLVWSSAPEWTAEEQAASDGGKFDDRPAYLLKLPNQHQETKIDTPFAATETRELLDRLMQGKISSAGELASWVAGLPHHV